MVAADLSADATPHSSQGSQLALATNSTTTFLYSLEILLNAAFYLGPTATVRRSSSCRLRHSIYLMARSIYTSGLVGSSMIPRCAEQATFPYRNRPIIFALLLQIFHFPVLIFHEQSTRHLPFRQSFSTAAPFQLFQHNDRLIFTSQFAVCD